jgi:hypothetical protein
MQNLENHSFLRPQSRFREKRCGRVRFGFKGGFSFKLKSYLRREIFPHVLPGGGKAQRFELGERDTEDLAVHIELLDGIENALGAETGRESERQVGPHR